MINRRSVPALHRACLHLMQQPETEKTDGILRPDPLKTDMTAVPSNFGMANPSPKKIADKGECRRLPALPSRGYSGRYRV
jgi:hypothetical protein